MHRRRRRWIVSSLFRKKGEFVDAEANSRRHVEGVGEGGGAV